MRENVIVCKKLTDILGDQNVEGDADQDINDGDNDESVEITNILDTVFEDECDDD